MFFISNIICLVVVFRLINAYGVTIDGILDLGPNWKYKYNIRESGNISLAAVRTSQEGDRRQGVIDDEISSNSTESTTTSSESSSVEIKEHCEKVSSKDKGKERVRDSYYTLPESSIKTLNAPELRIQQKRYTKKVETEIIDVLNNAQINVEFAVDCYIHDRKGKTGISLRSHNKNRFNMVTRMAEFSENSAEDSTVYENNKPRKKKKGNQKNRAVEKKTRPTRAYNQFKFKSLLASSEQAIGDINDTSINEFMERIRTRTIKLLHKLKRNLTDYHVKRKINLVADNYNEKFGEFINETRTHKVKTRLGVKKALSNIVETSNNILNRLLNYLIKDLETKGVLRTSVGAFNDVKKAVEDMKQTEIKELCAEFQICSTARSFGKFLTDCLTLVSKTDDAKFKQAMDVVFEVMKNAELDILMDQQKQNLFRTQLKQYEMLSMASMRRIINILRNTVANRNKPLVLTEAPGPRVNKTLAFLEIIESIDRSLEKKQEFFGNVTDVFMGKLTAWNRSQINDLSDIIDTFSGLVKSGLEFLAADPNSVLLDNTRNMLKILL